LNTHTHTRVRAPTADTRRSSTPKGHKVVSRRVHRAFQDLRQRRYVDAYVAWLVAILVVIINVVTTFVTNSDKLTALVMSTIVLLLGIIALATAEIRRDLEDGGPGSPRRVWRFFAGRAELSPVRERIESSSREMYIFGAQLGQIVHDALPLIERRAHEGYKISLALVNPIDSGGQPVPWIADIGVVTGFPNLDETLRANIRHLKLWHLGLQERQRRNVFIRVFRAMPTAAVIIVDPGSADGYVHVEPFLYRFSPAERPSFWIRRIDAPVLYETLLSNYLELWNSAEVISDPPS